MARPAVHVVIVDDPSSIWSPLCACLGSAAQLAEGAFASDDAPCDAGLHYIFGKRAEGKSLINDEGDCSVTEEVARHSVEEVTHA
jgi:hypothetical protein